MQREAHYVIIVERISQAVGRALTGVVLVAMVAVIVSDVFLRYFFNRPILGSNEIVGFLMVVWDPYHGSSNGVCRGSWICLVCIEGQACQRRIGGWEVFKKASGSFRHY